MSGIGGAPGWTWEGLAEERETIAKAWTLRAREAEPRLQAAMLADAEDFIGEARSFRDAAAAGAPLLHDFAALLAFAH